MPAEHEAQMRRMGMDWAAVGEATGIPVAKLQADELTDEERQKLRAWMESHKPPAEDMADRQPMLVKFAAAGIGEGRWVDVFRAGDYGRKGSWTEKDLDRIVQDYDPAMESAALSYDHREDGPSQGWAEALRRVGSVLQARFRDVSRDVMEGTAARRWMRQSAEIYPAHPVTGGPYLKGLTLLGVRPPAVRGLAPVEFSTEAGSRQWIGFNADSVPYVRVYSALTYEEGMQMPGKQDQTQDPQVARFAAIEAENLALKAQIAESTAAVTQMTAQVQSLQRYAADARAAEHRTRITSLLDELGRQGKVSPAERQAWERVLGFATEDQVVTWSEGGAEKSAPIFDLIAGALKSRVAIVPMQGQTPGLLRASDIDAPGDVDEAAEQARVETDGAVAEGKIKPGQAAAFYDRAYRARLGKLAAH